MRNELHAVYVHAYRVDVAAEPELEEWDAIAGVRGGAAKLKESKVVRRTAPFMRRQRIHHRPMVVTAVIPDVSNDARDVHSHRKKGPMVVTAVIPGVSNDVRDVHPYRKERPMGFNQDDGRPPRVPDASAVG